MTTIITTAATTTTTTTTTIIIVTFTILLTTTNYFNRLTKQTNKRQHQKHASQFSCCCNFSCCFCINLKCNIFFNSLQCLFVCLRLKKSQQPESYENFFSLVSIVIFFLKMLELEAIGKAYEFKLEFAQYYKI